MKKYLALYVGEPSNGPPPEMSQETIQAGMKAWGDWMEANAGRIVEQGGPLSRTKKASKDGITDIRNKVAGYVVISAESQDEAVRLFEGHPHFSIFPGEAVEVMEVLPIPGM